MGYFSGCGLACGPSGLIHPTPGEKKAREEQEKARKTYEGFQVHALTAVMKLSEANAIALQNGKCNGETHKALEYLTEVRHQQRDFLITQGLDNIF